MKEKEGSHALVVLNKYACNLKHTYNFIHFVQEKNTTTSVQDEFMHLLLWGKAR